MKRKSHLLAACCGVFLASVAAGASSADSWPDNTTWNILGAFNDNGTLTGSLSFNVYGYIDGYNLITGTTATYTGAIYNRATEQIAPSVTGVTATFFSGLYNGQNLALQVVSSVLNDPSQVTLAGYECKGTYSSCSNANADRTLVMGSAVEVPAPEAATGFAALAILAAGALWRRRRAQPAQRTRVTFGCTLSST